MSATQAQRDTATAVYVQLKVLPRPHPDRYVESDIDAAVADMASIIAFPHEWEEEAVGWAIETAEGTVYDATVTE